MRLICGKHLFSNRKDSLTTKAAYFLGLTGPAISINTSCSTGLVSIIEACRNIQLGTCLIWHWLVGCH
ncbi:beta-ketoacyl synthase N-terminal-like domain-containing protein [Salmonella enterica]|uniref:beta-ketoacyl synthase N-terminal-like domain-containing protein n=1 Tax=Salmonella enterica TaxID=28901 RepID=UPI00098DDF27